MAVSLCTSSQETFTMEKLISKMLGHLFLNPSVSSLLSTVERDDIERLNKKIYVCFIIALIPLLSPKSSILSSPRILYLISDFLLPFSRSSFLISLFICDFALMWSSWALVAGCSLLVVVCPNIWLRGRTSCWLEISFSVGDFYVEKQTNKQKKQSLLWWGKSLLTNVFLVLITNSMPQVGWNCWFFTLLW